MENLTLKSMTFSATQLPRQVIQIFGPEAEVFLQGLITQDVYHVGNELCYGFFLNAQGRYLFDGFIFHLSGGLCIDVAQEDAEDLVQHLKKYVLGRDITITLPDDIEIWGFWGSETFPFEKSPGRVWPDPRWAGLGWRGVGFWGNRVDTPCDPEAYDMWLGQHGIPDPRCFVRHKTIPLLYGIQHLSGISWAKGCYMGQELMARAHYQGQIRRHLFCVRGSVSDLPDRIKQYGELCWHKGEKALALLDAEGVRLLAESEGIQILTPLWRRS